MIAEDDINFSNTIDPAELDWFYASVRLTNADELFALVAVEKDKKSVILRYPIKVIIQKAENDTYNLKWAEYNPFSDDEYTRFRIEQVHSMNFLNDKFRDSYKQILKDKYGEEDDPPASEDGEDLPGETPAPPEAQNDEPDFIPMASANVKSNTNKKLH